MATPIVAIGDFVLFYSLLQPTAHGSGAHIRS